MKYDNIAPFTQEAIEAECFCSMHITKLPFCGLIVTLVEPTGIQARPDRKLGKLCAIWVHCDEASSFSTSLF